MTAAPLLCLVAGGSYLLGAIPFGYLVGRWHGVDILQKGSGNIGATNVGRVLGRWWGILVFVLDFTKGAGPVLMAGWLADPTDRVLLPGTLPVTAGVAAFLGHLFPIYLGFRGGKGVATGAGVITVLVPLITLAVVAVWAIVLAATRLMSLASLTAAALLLILRLALTPQPWSEAQLVVTLFCLLGCLLVFARHHANIRRLLTGTEHRL